MKFFICCCCCPCSPSNWSDRDSEHSFTKKRIASHEIAIPQFLMKQDISADIMIILSYIMSVRLALNWSWQEESIKKNEEILCKVLLCYTVACIRIILSLYNRAIGVKSVLTLVRQDVLIGKQLKKNLCVTTFYCTLCYIYYYTLYILPLHNVLDRTHTLLWQIFMAVKLRKTIGN